MSRQPEGRLVKHIQKLVSEKGGRSFKIHGGGKGEEAVFQEVGIPDLLVCYRGRFLGWEVKQPGEEPSRIQQYVLDEIEAAGGYPSVVTTVEEAAHLLTKVDKECDE
jgi:hypothetical protein